MDSFYFSPKTVFFGIAYIST